MKLKTFEVTNYKIFKDKFAVDLIKDPESSGTFTILTGKNNMGKSTFLEAINEFFKLATKGLTISGDCFNQKNNKIMLNAEFIINKTIDEHIWTFLEENALLSNEVTEDQTLNITKSYELNKPAVYLGSINGTSISTSDIKKLAILINKEEPYYIRPNMTTEEIDKLISTIYADAISASSESNSESLQTINQQIRDSLSTLKSDTDNLLKKVEKEVSDTLNQLFTGQNFNIRIDGGDSLDLSIKDLLKNTNTTINIDSNSKDNMLLAEQGTGVQRMSLIYTIQSIIKLKIGNLGSRMLLIDEPEAFLHPEATRQLSSSLYEIGNSMPIIITTHSPILINLENDHTSIDIFRIDKNNSNAVNLYTSKEKVFDADDIGNMKILNYVDSYINEFFFSEKNIIVEGSTEKLVLQYIQNKYNVSFHVINANGKSTINTIMKILNQFDTNYYVLHDLDNNSDNSENRQSSLKSERTKCRTILNLKNSRAKIYATNHTFEKVFYNTTVSSNVKTKKIFDILNSNEEDTIKYPIKLDILKTFNAIFDLGIKELEIDTYNEKVIEIISQKDIDEQFENLIIVDEIPVLSI